MEQPPNPPVQQPNNHSDTTLNYAIQYYFLQQGQSITKLHELLRSNIVAYGFKAFLSVVFQLFCYLLFALAIYVAIMFPTNLPGLVLLLDKNVSIEFIPHVKELTDFFIALKIIIGIMAIPILVCALLTGRNRRKSARIRKSFNETEMMMKNFELALRQFKF
ncbi:MAG: hypothetical protein ABIQ40_03580 [Bacteroidia bacterium]